MRTNAPDFHNEELFFIYEKTPGKQTGTRPDNQP
jgi:hypothetical protein